MIKKELAVIDAETDPFKFGRPPKPFIWGLRTQSEYKEFFNTQDLIDYIQNKELIIYAHNGGRFDFHFLSHWFNDNDEIMIINGRIAKVFIGACELRDSFLLFPTSLDKYKKTKIDYSIFEKKERIKPANMIKIRAYLKDDCDYLFQLISRFNERYGNGLTLAGTAMKQWRKISKTDSCGNSNSFYYGFFKPYYYGGRVQTFKTGEIKKGAQFIDINSAYPFAMTHPHPYGFIYSQGKKETIYDQSFIKLSARSMGCFPIRLDTGLSFPNDGKVREFFITGWEYFAAMATDQLKDFKILTVTNFYTTIEFTEYVNKFYAEKVEAKRSGDKLNYLFAKHMQNALYGKYAANPEKYKRHIITREREEIEHFEHCGFLGERPIYERDLLENEKTYYNICTAASITGFVRAMLIKTLNACEGVYYCDTDSIIADTIKAVAISDKLGDWEIEGKIERGYIAGKKLYAVKTNKKWKVASKGVKLTWQEIKKLSEGKTIKYKFDAPTFSVKKGPSFTKRKIKTGT